ncbi:hypothetical protein COV93_04970 [Candidatus Woesearchaeota archaeon CG11_big_fil_rev_8_21_14_0_20_43_8]|nr:MAG: hypothetical protein COV93_04970 [Candidatus Woesearchaeota archaeon CG11_big_fil_rev_8_21_14_0_20_43_8]PIO05607.1 MAG: hypothetical protein COT47_04055 [Candidatus Woesearchaeota archaeon CG08_land_8_20_14_0_20_43_7]
MQKRYYFDTAIWRDYYENRDDGIRPLGEFALQAIYAILRNHDFILYSKVVEDELKKEYDSRQITEIFSIAKEKQGLIKVDVKYNQRKIARKLCQMHDVPFSDALHAVLARDNHAVLITRDHHFERLVDITQVTNPESLI